MSSWFSQKLGRAFNAASAAGAAGTKRTRLDCSSSIASGGKGGNNNSNSPSPAVVSRSQNQNQQPQLLATKVSTDHFADLEHSQPANANVNNQRFETMLDSGNANSSSRNNLDPRDTKRRCFHNDANHQQHMHMWYSDSALPQYYHPHHEPHGPASSAHADAYGRDQGFFSSWPGSEYQYPPPPHPQAYQRAYSSGAMMQMEPAYHNHQGHASPFSPPTSAGGGRYHRQSSYYSADHHGQRPPIAPPTSSSKSPKHTLLAASAKSQLSFQRQNSAFSSIADLDPDDAEVQEHNMSSSQPSRPKAMPSPCYAVHNHPVGGHWYPSHQQAPPPPAGYPYYPPPPPPMAEGYYGHPPITSPAQRSHRNLSCYSSPRHSIHGGHASTFGASAMWSTMKVGMHARPNNPMATLFNYVGEEHRHMRGAKNPSGEEYFVVTNHPCADDDVSEISLDSIYDRHDPAARYIEERIDEYPEYREPTNASVRGNGGGAGGRVPLSIDIPTVHEDQPLQAYNDSHAPRHQSIHRVSNYGDGSSMKPSPKNGKIQRIVSCDDRHSPMVM